MKWEEFNPVTSRAYIFEKYELTEIECPICGSLLRKRTDIVLTTNPPRYKYECHACGWSGAK